MRHESPLQSTVHAEISACRPRAGLSRVEQTRVLTVKSLRIESHDQADLSPAAPSFSAGNKGLLLGKQKYFGTKPARVLSCAQLTWIGS